VADKSKTVIVRRIKKGHGEAHGGSWKVAYADFMTAMMAFFLLLWLISMVTPEKRAVVADYFRNYSLFKESGRSFMWSSSGIKQELKTATEEPATGATSLQDVQSKLKMTMNEELKGLQDQVLIDKVEGGIRIQVVDLEGKPMFRPGSAVPTEKCRQILMAVSAAIKDSKVRIAVEGHTDTSSSQKGRESNWELSTSRASSARKLLESNGITQEKIAKVVGYADTDLLFQENPADARNRRISLILSPLIEKKVAAPPPDASKTDQQPLSIVPPSIAPPVQDTPAPRLEEKKPAPPQEEHKNRVIDPGIKPQKPIDIRPTLFPNMKQ
jgi:chemotaxis protein MotB